MRKEYSNAPETYCFSCANNIVISRFLTPGIRGIGGGTEKNGVISSFSCLFALSLYTGLTTKELDICTFHHIKDYERRHGAQLSR